MKRPENGRIDFGEVGTVRFRGKTWTLGVAKLKQDGLRGVCIEKRQGKCAILIGDHLPADGPMSTEAIIHETLHAAFPKASENQVEAGAALVARVLRVFEKAKRVH